MLVNGQLKNAQLEILENKVPGTKGRISYNPECESIEIDDGTACKRIMDQGDSPVGMVIMWPCESPPSDRYLLANGAELTRAQYPELFTALGEKYGSGDGTSTFKIPDYRGYFMRGTDNGRGCDPDAADRVDRGDGTSGDAVGTTQDFEVQSHTHSYSDDFAEESNVRGDRDNSDFVRFDSTTAKTTGATGGSETRPKNININFMIKVK